MAVRVRARPHRPLRPLRTPAGGRQGADLRAALPGGCLYYGTLEELGAKMDKRKVALFT